LVFLEIVILFYPEFCGGCRMLGVELGGVDVELELLVEERTLDLC
jgi:hypothetical protein